MLKNEETLRHYNKTKYTNYKHRKKKELQVDGIGYTLNSVTAENFPQIPERCTHSNVMTEKYFMT